MNASRKRRWPLRLLLAAFLLAVFFFLFRDIARGWGEIRAYGFRFDPLNLGLSVVLFTVSYLFLTLGWRTLVAAFGPSLPLRNSFRLVVQSMLGHYLPGRVWAPASLVYLGSKWGVPTAVGVICAVLSTVLVAVSGFVFSAPWIVFGLDRGYSLTVAAGLAALALGAGALHPAILPGLLNAALKKIGREPLRLDYRYRDLLRGGGFYLLFWLAMGGGFVFALRAVVPVGGSGFWALASIHALSYSLGVAAVFTPAGLGVREGAAAVLLGRYFPAPLPAALSVYGRLWTTVCEGLAFLLALCFRALPEES